MTRKVKPLEHQCPTPVGGCDETMQCIEGNIAKLATSIADDESAIQILREAIDTFVERFDMVDNGDDTTTITAIMSSGVSKIVGTVAATSGAITSIDLVSGEIVVTTKDGDEFKMDSAPLNEKLGFDANGYSLTFEDGEGGTTSFDDGRVSSDDGNVIFRGTDGGLYAPTPPLPDLTVRLNAPDEPNQTHRIFPHSGLWACDDAVFSLVSGSEQDCSNVSIEQDGVVELKADATSSQEGGYQFQYKMTCGDDSAIYTVIVEYIKALDSSDEFSNGYIVANGWDAGVSEIFVVRTEFGGDVLVDFGDSAGEQTFSQGQIEYEPTESLSGNIYIRAKDFTDRITSLYYLSAQPEPPYLYWDGVGAPDTVTEIGSTNNEGRNFYRGYWKDYPDSIKIIDISEPTFGPVGTFADLPRGLETWTVRPNKTYLSMPGDNYTGDLPRNLQSAIIRINGTFLGSLDDLPPDIKYINFSFGTQAFEDSSVRGLPRSLTHLYTGANNTTIAPDFKLTGDLNELPLNITDLNVSNDGSTLTGDVNDAAAIRDSMETLRINSTTFVADATTILQLYPNISAFWLNGVQVI